MHEIIERQYDSMCIYSIDGNRVAESMEEFKRLPEAHRARLKVLKGHMAFGLHEYMPQPCVYITMLRDPVERVISHYNYVLRTPVHYLYKQVTEKKMTLREYVDGRISDELDNGQTRLIANMGAPIGGCTEEMLEQAKRNLREHFAVVGFQEQFDETLMLLMKRFGWGMLYYTMKNVTKDRPLRGDIPKDVIAIIEEYNRLDMELVAYARKLFDNEMKRDTQPVYCLKVGQISWINGRYGKIISKAV